MRFVITGLTKSGRAAWQEEEDTRKYFSIVLILQEQFCTSALQGRSVRNLVDPSSQDNVSIPDNFFEYICQNWMRNQFTFHHQFKIDTRRPKFEQKQTVFFLLVDLMDKECKDPDKIDLGAPRLAQYMHKAWKNIKTL